MLVKTHNSKLFNKPPQENITYGRVLDITQHSYIHGFHLHNHLQQLLKKKTNNEEQTI